MKRVDYEQFTERDEPSQKFARNDDEPRRYHSHFCNCFGECDGIGWGSCCLVYWFPYVAFGMNVAKATGKVGRAIICALLMLLLTGAIQSSHFILRYYAERNPCSNRDPYELCTQADVKEYQRQALIFGSVAMVAFAGLVTMGVVNRQHTRRALDMESDGDGAECLDDFFAWCCFPLGLCQETRTLLYNRVHNGEWRGPETMGASYV